MESEFAWSEFIPLWQSGKVGKHLGLYSQCKQHGGTLVGGGNVGGGQVGYDFWLAGPLDWTADCRTFSVSAFPIFRGPSLTAKQSSGLERGNAWECFPFLLLRDWKRWKPKFTNKNRKIIASKGGKWPGGISLLLCSIISHPVTTTRANPWKAVNA